MQSGAAVDVVPMDVKEAKSLDSKDKEIEDDNSMQSGHDALEDEEPESDESYRPTPEDSGMQDDEDNKPMQSATSPSDCCI